jgi:peptidoglycan/xylan/chitin deacetylase (PgdA/CDA1 family)
VPLLRKLRNASRSDLRVLAYHRVLESAEPQGFHFDAELISASAAAFREQMLHLRKHFSPMRFDEVLELFERGRALPRNAVLVSFDDGYDDNYRVAYPILRELGMSAMFFVSTGHIDSGRAYAYDWLVHMVCTTQAAWLKAPALGFDRALGTTLAERRAQAAELLERLKVLPAEYQAEFISRLETEWGMPRQYSPPDCRPMSWDQLREMHQNGMEVGSHGVHHNILAKLPHERMVAEVRESKATLDRELGVPVKALSYPVGGFGAFDQATETAVREAGFRMACSYISGAGKVNRDTLYALPRLSVERQMDQAWFEAMLAWPEIFAYASRLRTG